MGPGRNSTGSSTKTDKTLLLMLQDQQWVKVQNVANVQVKLISIAAKTVVNYVLYIVCSE